MPARRCNGPRTTSSTHPAQPDPRSAMDNQPRNAAISSARILAIGPVRPGVFGVDRLQPDLLPLTAAPTILVHELADDSARDLVMSIASPRATDGWASLRIGLPCPRSRRGRMWRRRD